jgi:hypothetical protein
VLCQGDGGGGGWRVAPVRIIEVITIITISAHNMPAQWDQTRRGISSAQGYLIGLIPNYETFPALLDCF